LDCLKKQKQKAAQQSWLQVTFSGYRNPAPQWDKTCRVNLNLPKDDSPPKAKALTWYDQAVTRTRGK